MIARLLTRARWAWLARTTRIRDVGDGAFVRIAGTVRLVGASLAAPVSGRRCAYHAVVERYEWDFLSHKNRGFPASCDFMLDDGEGRARVDVTGARFEVRVDHVSHLIVDRMGRGRDGKMRPVGPELREAALVDGKRVIVAGTARWEPDPSPDAAATYRDAPRRLVLESAPGRPLVVSDA